MSLRFTEHRTGGGWAGGTFARNCSEEQFNAITSHYNNVLSCIRNNSCLGQAMRDRIDSREIEIDCGSNCGGSSLERSGAKITVCDLRANSFALYFTRAVVRAAGLSGLDAFVAGRLCFPGDAVANPIGAADWNAIKEGTSNRNNILWFGEFVVWDSDSGVVSRRDRDNPGERCFQSNDWIHRYPGGGWI